MGLWIGTSIIIRSGIGPALARVAKTRKNHNDGKPTPADEEVAGDRPATHEPCDHILDLRSWLTRLGLTNKF